MFVFFSGRVPAPSLSSAGRKNLLSLCLLIACCHFPMAQAGRVTLDEFDSGNINITSSAISGNVLSAEHNENFDGLSVRAAAAGIFSLAFLETGYLIFDLSDVVDPVSAGSIGFDIETIIAPDGMSDINIFEVTSVSASDLSSLPVGPLTSAQGESYRDDFSGGNLLASLDSSDLVDDGLYQFSLTDYAIDLINSTTDLLAVGVSWFSFPSSVRISMPSTLTLDTEEPTPVPAPGTLILIGFGLSTIGWMRRKKA